MLVLDNGNSFLEIVLAKFGARKNNWRFFQPQDFIKPSQQYTFGFLSCFSLENRLGVVGRVIDSTFYFFDIFLSKLTNRPTVILTVYRK